jgi:hypothetical protein
MSQWEPELTQEEKDLALHIAKMFEHAEWENTLPEQEKSRRRLSRFIATLPQAAKTAIEFEMPILLLKHLERIVHHAEVVFGDRWRETAQQQRLLETVFGVGSEGDDDKPEWDEDENFEEEI